MTQTLVVNVIKEIWKILHDSRICRWWTKQRKYSLFDDEVFEWFILFLIFYALIDSMLPMINLTMRSWVDKTCLTDKANFNHSFFPRIHSFNGRSSKTVCHLAHQRNVQNCVNWLHRKVCWLRLEDNSNMQHNQAICDKTKARKINKQINSNLFGPFMLRILFYFFFSWTFSFLF